MTPFNIRMIALMLGLAVSVFAGPVRADPPGRVARLGYLSGPVSFSPAGEDEWSRSTLNRPLTTGDRLWSAAGARAEIQVGGAVVRMNARTSVAILNLDDRITQLQLTQGTLNVRVSSLAPDQTFEVATPNLAFTLRQPGAYRIEVDPDGEGTSLYVRYGEGNAYGEGAAYRIDTQQAYRFTGTGLRDYEAIDTRRADDFDLWSSRRDRAHDESVSARYVSPDVVGYQDLDSHGVWRNEPSYGSVWVPTSVVRGWAPYRDGHWAWVHPWGWTWVDDEPWGYAVSHYGRWANQRGTWFWVPGPVSTRAYYAPALVAFVGGNGFQISISTGSVGGVAWFPLAPREVYRPSYATSRGYFENINRSNTVISNTVINNTYNTYNTTTNVTNVTNVVYANRQVPGAVVAVPTSAFVQSQPVSRVAVQLPAIAATSVPVTRAAPVQPIQKSVLGGAPEGGKPPPRVFDRVVVARSTPPPLMANFAALQLQAAAKSGRPIDDARRAGGAPTSGAMPAQGPALAPVRRPDVIVVAAPAALAAAAGTASAPRGAGQTDAAEKGDRNATAGRNASANPGVNASVNGDLNAGDLRSRGANAGAAVVAPGRPGTTAPPAALLPRLERPPATPPAAGVAMPRLEQPTAAVRDAAGLAPGPAARGGAERGAAEPTGRPASASRPGAVSAPPVAAPALPIATSPPPVAVPALPVAASPPPFPALRAIAPTVPAIAPRVSATPPATGPDTDRANRVGRGDRAERPGMRPRDAEGVAPAARPPDAAPAARPPAAEIAAPPARSPAVDSAPPLSRPSAVDGVPRAARVPAADVAPLPGRPSTADSAPPSVRSRAAENAAPMARPPAMEGAPAAPRPPAAVRSPGGDDMPLVPRPPAGAVLRDASPAARAASAGPPPRPVASPAPVAMPNVGEPLRPAPVISAPPPPRRTSPAPESELPAVAPPIVPPTGAPSDKQPRPVVNPPPAPPRPVLPSTPPPAPPRPVPLVAPSPPPPPMPPPVPVPVPVAPSPRVEPVPQRQPDLRPPVAASRPAGPPEKRNGKKAESPEGDSATPR